MSRKTRKTRRGGGIRYGGLTVNGKEIAKTATKAAPTVSIPPGHFLIMWDRNAMAGTYLHWIQDVAGAIVPYEGPAPPPGTGTHNYVFRLIKGTPKDVPTARAAVDVGAVIDGQPILYEKEMAVVAKSK